MTMMYENLAYSKIPCKCCGETILQWTKRKRILTRKTIYTVKCIKCGVSVNGESLIQAIDNWEKENDKGKGK